MATLTGGQLVARMLKKEGVGTVFTLSGLHVAPIYAGCVEEGIRLVDTRHEQAAAHAADAWARLAEASIQMGVTFETDDVGSFSTAAGEWVTPHGYATVGDGQATVVLDDLGGRDPNVVINALQLSAGEW